MQDRTRFWIDFICANAPYPEPARLRGQLDAASYSDFCKCGCNSFSVSVPSDTTAAPLTNPGGRGGMVFDCAFRLEDSGASLEILLFVDGFGNLSFIEVDCNSNSEPVPPSIRISGPPYHVWASDHLLS
jgi:hypothetical protein